MDLSSEEIADTAPTVPSADLPNVGQIEKEPSLVMGASPAPSNCSILSEQDGIDHGSISRQSPYMSISQASPCSSTSALFQRPDYLNVSFPDSETSSRSSFDGISLSASKREYRKRRKNSSDSSDSDTSELTAGGESFDGEESSSRKSSRNKGLDEALVTGTTAARAVDAPRSRIANIRRESNCSVDNEVAHERLVKNSHQVAVGFDEFSLDANRTTPTPEVRNRTSSFTAGSVGEPISIVTNPFLTHSCSPSPTRHAEGIKQCYSPSTQQIVRPNIPYSPSPSPTQSPTRQRLLRSLSPITTRTAIKRRYPTSNPMDEIDAKRGFPRNSTSPLVTERSFPYPSSSQSSNSSTEFAQPQMISVGTHSIVTRKPTIDFELMRRISVESVSDDQKSTKDEKEEKDDISEPSSVQGVETDDRMDAEDSSSAKFADFTSTIPEDLLAEADAAPLPDADDTDL